MKNRYNYIPPGGLKNYMIFANIFLLQLNLFRYCGWIANKLQYFTECEKVQYFLRKLVIIKRRKGKT